MDSRSVLNSPFDPFDRRTGNGSGSTEDDWLDENSTAAQNQWSTARTTFRVNDAPAHRREHFENLYRTHNGWGEGDRDQTILRSHIVADAETFGAVLELPKPQRRRIKSIAQEIDMSSQKFGGKPYEKILLAICSLVADSAISDKTGGSPDPEKASRRLILRDEFRDLMDAANLGSREHRKIRQMLRDRTSYFS